MILLFLLLLLLLFLLYEMYKTIIVRCMQFCMGVKLGFSH